MDSSGFYLFGWWSWALTPARMPQIWSTARRGPEDVIDLCVHRPNRAGLLEEIHAHGISGLGLLSAPILSLRLRVDMVMTDSSLICESLRAILDSYRAGQRSSRVTCVPQEYPGHGLETLIIQSIFTQSP
jgi:hypothetical protein